MKVTGKLSSGCSSLILSALLVISATTVRADSDSDHTPNFGVRGNRITSNCAGTGRGPRSSPGSSPSYHFQ